MKVFISADLEGITGVVHGEELTEGTGEWQRARHWMTADILAACDGARAAGAAEILVVDGHSGMRNVLFDQLPSDVTLHRGPAAGRTMCQVEGLDATSACVLLIGYHSMAGSAGLLSHTWHGGVVATMRLNGQPIGETAITAAIAGHHGVPVVLATGDQHLVSEATITIPGITTVEVKRSTGRQNARCLPLGVTGPLIAAASERAVRDLGSVRPVMTASPCAVEIDTVHQRHADRIERFCKVERIGIRTVRIVTEDAPSAFTAAWLAVEVADFEPGVWNR